MFFFCYFFLSTFINKKAYPKAMPNWERERE